MSTCTVHPLISSPVVVDAIRTPGTLSYKHISPQNFPSTTTTDWHKDTPPDAQTRLDVLAASQEPFLPHNSWKYSFKGPHAVYPPYDRKPFPKVPNVLNR